MKIHIILISILLVVLTCNTEAQKKGEGVVPPMYITGEPWEGYKEFDDEYYLGNADEQWTAGEYIADIQIFTAFLNTYNWIRELYPDGKKWNPIQRQRIVDEWGNEKIRLLTSDFEIGIRKRFLKSRNENLYIVYIKWLHNPDEYETAKEDPMRYILMRAGMFAEIDESVMLLKKLEQEYEILLSEDQ